MTQASKILASVCNNLFKMFQLLWNQRERPLKWRHDIHHNDTQHIYTRYIDTRYNDTQHIETKHNITTLRQYL
jgi:hypothetical protein